jgi:pyridoxine kinase
MEKDKTHLKRVAAIHDLSGFGKCSLTVALPILSAAGIEACALPTAILSTHTGGIDGYTYLDTTTQMRPFTRHWQSLDIRFDAIYSGFLGSFEQLEIVKGFFDTFRRADNLILVDPVMADNGELYKIFTPDFAAGMRSLCEKADIIVPNITEATLLLGESYRPGPYSKDYIDHLLKELHRRLGPRQIVLTGVYFSEAELGVATFDAADGKTEYSLVDKIPGYYHGTGDVYASALLAALMNGSTLSEAAGIAVRFTAGSIRRTWEEGADIRFGVNFEDGFPRLLKDLRLLSAPLRPPLRQARQQKPAT